MDGDNTQGRLTLDIVRNAILDLMAMDKRATEEIVDDMVAYFQRRNDHATVKDKIKSRYGVSIRHAVDPTGSQTSDGELPGNQYDMHEMYGTYNKGDVHAKVDLGITESVSVGFGNSIISQLASLFTENGLRYGYNSKTDEEKDTSDVDKFMSQMRKTSGFQPVISEVDERAVQCGSAAMLITFQRNACRYQLINPNRITAYFGNYVTEDGVKRQANKTDIDDASVVIIKLGQVDIGKYAYLAICGRSDIYPVGRWVTFIDGETVNRLPDPYDKEKEAIEYEDGGKVANPLAVYAENNPDLDSPEYPISIIYSGVAGTDELLPISTSLYQNCIEVDVSASHTLGCSNDAARGTLVITRDSTALGMPLPRSLNGAIALPNGMKADHISHDPSGAKMAQENLKSLQVSIAQGYHVPDYMVSSEDHTVEASSGVALEVKTKPLDKFRSRRVSLNEASVARIFDIERVYLSEFYEGEDRSVVDSLNDIVQEWDAGDIELPSNQKEVVEMVNSMVDKGLADTIEALKILYKLRNDNEAIELYETMKERSNQYPPLVEEKKEVAPVQGANRSRFGRNQGVNVNN